MARHYNTNFKLISLELQKRDYKFWVNLLSNDTPINLLTAWRLFKAERHFVLKVHFNWEQTSIKNNSS